MPSSIRSSRNSRAAALLVRQARRARADPNELIEFCLADSHGVPLRQAPVHRELQTFLGEQSRALVELPRDHGKSVQLCGRVLWELGRDPALRVKLVCATDPLAEQRSRYLREHLATNPRLALVFPHLKPAEPWAAEAFTVSRPAAVIGPSVAAFGVGAASTGARADLLVCDDLVDVRSLHSAAERRRVRDYFHDNLLNLLEPTGRFWNLSTPWHPDDLNAHLKRNPAFSLFRRAVTPELESPWPAKWPREALERRQAEIGAASFARGYYLEPFVEGDAMIQAEDVVRIAEPLPRDAYETVVLSVDPAVSEKARADASAVVALGRRKDAPGVDCLASVARRVRTPELVELLAAWDEVWKPDAILFESNAAFAGVCDLLMRHAAFGRKIVGVTQSKSKAARVAAFSVTVQNRLFRLPMGQGELFAEMTTFPHAPHDDLLDAAATGAEYLLGRRELRVWV